MPTTEAARMRQHLETEIARLGAAIGLKGRDVPTFVNHDGAHPFISVGNGVLAYLALERGALCFEHTTRDPDELLFWAFRDATALPALAWANERQYTGDGHLAARWQRRAVLLHTLDPAWARRWRDELAETLGPEHEHRHLLPALPPPPLVPDPAPPGPPAGPGSRPAHRRRWWHRPDASP
ncbi:Imm63 family immunity protein [Kitasatospora sp. NPDC093550]|uniref:Imm63 family immunity protein n=1 Tax=Kitasatospora sp. NPDC093550 TaxID=3364089 RepID=UPI0037F8D643